MLQTRCECSQTCTSDCDSVHTGTNKKNKSHVYSVPSAFLTVSSNDTADIAGEEKQSMRFLKIYTAEVFLSHIIRVCHSHCKNICGFKIPKSLLWGFKPILQNGFNLMTLYHYSPTLPTYENLHFTSTLWTCSGGGVEPLEKSSN